MVVTPKITEELSGDDLPLQKHLQLKGKTKSCNVWQCAMQHGIWMDQTVPSGGWDQKQPLKECSSICLFSKATFSLWGGPQTLPILQHQLLLWSMLPAFLSPQGAVKSNSSLCSAPWGALEVRPLVSQLALSKVYWEWTAESLLPSTKKDSVTHVQEISVSQCPA
jgi:hypothetical protein